MGDFRKTGHLDMIAIGLDSAYSFSNQNILFLAGNGDGTFKKGTPLPATGADGILTMGDFNGDGKLDFVAMNGAMTHTLTVFLGNGDGTFRGLAPVTFTDSNESSVRMYTGDFNRDGKLDVLVFTAANGYWTSYSAVTMTANNLASTPRKASPFSVGRIVAVALLLPFGMIFVPRNRKRQASLVLPIGLSLLSVTSCGSGSKSGTGGGGGGGSNSYTIIATAYLAGTSVVPTLGTIQVTVTH